MFGRRLSHAGHSHTEHPHPLRRRVLLTILAAAVLAALALLIAPPHANGNFVYWTNGNPGNGNSVGRAKINGTGLNDKFIPGLSNPSGVAVDSRFIYWADTGADRIGRANLDGTGVNLNFITTGVSNPIGVAISSTGGIFWFNLSTNKIGHANPDGSNPAGDFVNPGDGVCGIAADQSFVYWLDNHAPSLSIGRAPVSGGAPDPTFISVSSTGCGLAVDGSFLYWSTADDSVGRAPVAGGTADPNFIPNATDTAFGTSGVAVNPQYVFWSSIGNPPGSNVIGRANINGSSPNRSLITGVSFPTLPVAAPSNKITVNSITKKKKKGTAAINAKVPGPGQVTLNQTNAPPDVNATAAAVKQVDLTITQASSFTLPVKPKGKTAKKLKKQVKKKGKGKVKVQVFIHFVPAGVAGVPNTDPVAVTLVKKGKKKK